MYLWKTLLLATLLSAVCLFCRDKAPGQRECDFSIDGINRCIRDIEQASLAAVSQSLATRDDISVEVRHRAVWTPCCSITAQSTATEGRTVLTGVFSGKVTHRPKCITSQKIPESPGNSRGESSYFLLPPTYYSDFLSWYDRLIELLWCLAMWKPD